MSYHVARLSRPYTARTLIEAYVYTKRQDFVHPDFGAYYTELLRSLEWSFEVRLAHEQLPSAKLPLWMLFENTVASALRITSPWDGLLEAGLLHRQPEQAGEYGEAVGRASATIQEAAKASRAAHDEMLFALFGAIFGERKQVVTSAELRQAGFDDACEPNISDYYDYF